MTTESKIVVSHMGAGHLLVYQPSTGGGLNLTAEEAKELIELLASYVFPELLEKLRREK